MAIDTRTPPTTPSETGRQECARDWMRSGMPDRHWESQDSIRFLELFDADVTQAAGSYAATTRKSIAMARLTDLDQVISQLVRERGSLVSEPEVMLAPLVVDRSALPV